VGRVLWAAAAPGDRRGRGLPCPAAGSGPPLAWPSWHGAGVHSAAAWGWGQRPVSPGWWWPLLAAVPHPGFLAGLEDLPGVFTAVSTTRVCG